jgi:RNA polymerase sigma-70 factor, ECF subfamily
MPTCPPTTRQDPIDSNLALLHQVQRGDHEALERLLGRVTPGLRHWAARLPRWARHTADDEDLVQETLVAILPRLQRFEPQHPHALDAYLRRAIANRIRIEIRRAKRRPTFVDVDVPAGIEASPLARLLAKDSRWRLEEGLAKLRPMERRAVLGRIGHGWSYQLLAEDLGKPSADAARKVVERALVRLGGLMRGGPRRRRSRGSGTAEPLV